MKNINRWEEIRVFGYIFISLGIVLFVIGIYIEATGFGTDGAVLSLIAAFGKIFKDTGTACGTIGGVLFTLSEGWKRN